MKKYFAAMLCLLVSAAAIGAGGAFALSDPASDAAKSGGSGYEYAGELGGLRSSGTFTEGKLKDYHYWNFRTGYCITIPSAETQPDGASYANIVLTVGGEWIRESENGTPIMQADSPTTEYVPIADMIADNYAPFSITQVSGLVPESKRDAVKAQMSDFIEEVFADLDDDPDTFFNLGTGSNDGRNYAIGMTGARFRYGDSGTGNFFAYSVGDFNDRAVNNAFVALVSNDLDGKTADTGYSFYLMRGKFYEEYIRQAAAGKSFGTVVSNDDVTIEKDGKSYVGQLFTGGYMYFEADGSVFSDNEYVYDPETKTFTRGAIENYVTPPSWMTGSRGEKISAGGGVYYFNFENGAVVATDNSGVYSYEYLGNCHYDTTAKKLVPDRMSKSSLCYFRNDPALWNKELIVDIVSQYYDMEPCSSDEFEKKVKDAIWKAYNKYCDRGIVLGLERGEGIMLWNKMIKVGFYGAEGGIGYEDTQNAFLVYNPELDEAFLMNGVILESLRTGVGGRTIGHPGDLGAPTGDIRTITEDNFYKGSVYQNFTTCYLLIERGFPLLKQCVEGKSFDGTIPFDAEKEAEADRQREEREREWEKNKAYQDYLAGKAVGTGCNAASASVTVVGCLAAAVVAKKFF